MISELGDFMLGVWIISCPSWQPAVDNVCDLLGSVFGVVGLVQQFPILPSSAMRDSRSTPRLLSCVKSSVMKTTVAISPL